jgi:hypothetical protein
MNKIIFLGLILGFQNVFAQVCGPTALYKERLDMSNSTVIFSEPGIYSSGNDRNATCGREVNLAICADNICKHLLGMSSGYSLALSKYSHSYNADITIENGEIVSDSTGAPYIATVYCKK